MKKYKIFCYLCLTVLFIAGCAKTVYVPVGVTTTRIVTQRDTMVRVPLNKQVEFVVVHDTTVVTAATDYAKATAQWDNATHRLSLRVENRSDSIDVPSKVVIEYVRDSVPYAIEVPVFKERKVAWYDKVCRSIAALTMIFVAFILVRFLLWRRRGL